MEEIIVLLCHRSQGAAACNRRPRGALQRKRVMFVLAPLSFTLTVHHYLKCSKNGRLRSHNANRQQFAHLLTIVNRKLVDEKSLSIMSEILQ